MPSHPASVPSPTSRSLGASNSVDRKLEQVASRFRSFSRASATLLTTSPHTRSPHIHPQ